MRLNISSPIPVRCCDRMEILNLLKWAIKKGRVLSVILRSGRQIEIRPLELVISEASVSLVLQGGGAAYSPLPFHQVSECFVARPV